MTATEGQYSSVGVKKAQSPSQTAQQVVASRHKFNLHKDLSWVAKWTRKFPRKYTQILKKIILRQTILLLLANISLMDVTRLKLTWWLDGQTVKNLLRLACKFDLDQSERKSSQVNAGARKPWPNGLASIPKFSTCAYLRLRLTRA